MREAVERQNLITQWLSWQFWETPKAILKGEKNVLVFNLNYFSVPLLFKTLFSFWRAYQWHYPRGFSFGQYLEVFFSNLISRLLGLLVRLTLIVVGLTVEIVLFLAGLCVLLVWLSLPFLILIGFWQGLRERMIILPSVALALWQFSLFFESKFRNPKLKASISEAIEQPETFNLVEFLDFQASRLVKKTFSLCQKKKINLNTAALFYFFLKENSPLVCFVFNRLLLNRKELLKNVQARTGSESIQGLMLEALQNAQKKGGSLVSLGSLMTALAKLDPFFTEVLVENDLKAADVENLCWWWEGNEKKLRERKKWWEYKNLVRLGSLGKDWAAGYTITLDRFSLDLTQNLKKTGFQEIIGHEREVRQLERVLAREQTNNALVVGEEGCGRGAMLEKLAQNILFGESLPELNYQRVVELNIPLLVNQYQNQEMVGQLLETIFAEIVLAKNIVLVIQDFHNFIGTNKGAGTTDISGTLLRYLQLPNFRLVGITSFSGFHRFIEPSPVSSLFEKIEVEQVSPTETIRLLELFVPAWERKYKKFISYPALRELVVKAERYLPAIPFPKKATDLMAELLVSLSAKKDPIILSQHVLDIVSEKARIPIGQTSIKEREILVNLEGLLHQRIINQEEAVKEVSSALRRARADITVRKGPMGTFLFLGPTGVGKTETAKALASLYFGERTATKELVHFGERTATKELVHFGAEERMIRLDLSEFQNSQDVKRLLGSIEEESFFVNAVRDNPFSLILLDELEKAHPNILNLFLQVLDEGFMRDGLGRKLSFLNTIIIATSNAGYQIILDAIEQNLNLELVKEKLLDHVFREGIFRPEFINRFDAVVVFKSLTKENLLAIAELLLKKLADNLSDKGIEMEITLELKEKIVELGYDPVFGARQMRRVIQDRLENTIASALLSGQIKRGDKIELQPPDFKLMVKNKS